MVVNDVSKSLELLEVPVVLQDSWEDLTREIPRVVEVVKVIDNLRSDGLTGPMVMADALRRRISPLCCWSFLVAYYIGDEDPNRTHVGSSSNIRP
ncbi:hypothetical protein E2562_018750 [Oryza meyeriana var. granulata]|uniref:Uncharacterized protein n=1 Tax=Oryza meyeriana var. granulata TaxID=110450 RepID=A0A6G1EMU6_9ORYZ|nr:hypothetical protein E2562_018750 [Oryza meyeriana var. granulata]